MTRCRVGGLPVRAPQLGLALETGPVLAVQLHELGRDPKRFVPRGEHDFGGRERERVFLVVRVRLFEHLPVAAHRFPDLHLLVLVFWCPHPRVLGRGAPLANCRAFLYLRPRDFPLSHARSQRRAARD